MTKLAVEGGNPVRSEPLAPWPTFSEEMVESVAHILRSGKINYWTGDEGRQFERDYAQHVGTEHAVALANGTVALEAALKALHIGPGDEVIVPSKTFIASASSAVMVGATPVVCDIDPESQNLTVDTIARRMTSKTRAIVAVHLAGWPCDMDPIMDYAQEHGLFVVEDCAQAHGATYMGRAVGSIGHVGTFSFCQDKIITTGGEGGLLVTHDQGIWERAWAYKDHGKDWSAVYNRSHPIGFRWLHESFGTNWRMTEMQAKLGRLQLELLPEWIRQRRANAAFLNDRISGIPAARTTIPATGFGHAYYKYYFFLNPDMLRPGWDRDRVLTSIIAEGIPCSTGACSEIYLEKAFPPTLRPPERLETARVLGETSLMLPVHPTLTSEDLASMAAAVEKVLSVAGK